MERCLARMRDERGQVVAWLVLGLLVVLLGVAATVADYGHAVSVRHRLQASADAAALAGARELPDAARALDAATRYGPRGGNPAGGIVDGSLDESLSTTCSSGSSECASPDVVVVHESARVGTWFAKVLGIDSLPVHVSSAACRDCIITAAATCTSGTSSISAAFDATPIAAGTTVWFASSLAIRGAGPDGAAVRFTHQTLTFAGRSVPVPDATVIFSSGAASATTAFDSVARSWRTTVPASLSGAAFLSGASFAVGSALPGGIDPVTWQGEFTSSVPGVTIDWQWSAAVYTAFGEYGDLGVKPVGDASSSSYANADPAGTPEAYKSRFTAGARG